jgi:hypothetical protein
MAALASLAATPAAAVSMLPPAELPMPVVVQTPAQAEQAMEQSARLHVLLKHYGITCGNPGCPLCNPPSPSSR